MLRRAITYTNPIDCFCVYVFYIFPKTSLDDVWGFVKNFMFKHITVVLRENGLILSFDRKDVFSQFLLYKSICGTTGGENMTSVSLFAQP